MNTILGNVKCSLDGIYYAFAPHYLTVFQYRFNRRYELAALPLPLRRPSLMSVV